MSVWSTQIPILPNRTIDNLALLCTKWITGSPHAKWTSDQMPLAQEGETVTADEHSQRISVSRIKDRSHEFFGFRHHWRDAEQREWITDIIGWRTQSSFLVGVHLDCQTTGVGVRIPDPKKPFIVGQILDELSGDMDGEFEVSSSPRFLSESELDVAERVFIGTTRHYLPVIYVSSTRKNCPAVDVDKLARWTSGMAHVVVEPSRSFSVALAARVDRRNSYGGAISIHWPAGGGPPSRFFPHRFDDPVRCASAVAGILRKALAGRRADPRITWDFLRELQFRSRINQLKQAGTAGVEDYIEAFDEERKLIKARVDALDEENGRLKQQLANYENQRAYSQTRGGEFLQGPDERELFPGEFADILARALRRARDNSQPDGRVLDVLDSFIASNAETGESDRIEKEIRDAMSSRTELGVKERKALEEVGFDISEDGKHYKLVFQGDDRYTFSMARTGSDWRGMKNWISDVTKRLFK